jgi:Flp pilus assembly protein TadG
MEGVRERGAMLVEFALLVPVIVLLSFGGSSLLSAYQHSGAIGAAARDGADYGAGLPINHVFDGSTWAHNVEQVMAERAAGELDARGVEVCVSLVEGSAGDVHVVDVNPAFTTNPDGGPCDATERYPGSARRVQVRITRPATLDLVAFHKTVKLAARATVRYQGPS